MIHGHVIASRALRRAVVGRDQPRRECKSGTGQAGRQARAWQAERNSAVVRVGIRSMRASQWRATALELVRLACNSPVLGKHMSSEIDLLTFEGLADRSEISVWTDVRRALIPRTISFGELD